MRAGRSSPRLPSHGARARTAGLASLAGFASRDACHATRECQYEHTSLRRFCARSQRPGQAGSQPGSARQAEVVATTMGKHLREKGSATPQPPARWKREELPVLLAQWGAFGGFVGRRRRAGKWLDEPCLTVMTSRKHAPGRGGVKRCRPSSNGRTAAMSTGSRRTCWRSRLASRCTALACSVPATA